MNSHHKVSKGFSLIELMTAITILAILTVIAMPNYRVWIQNTQIRTAAQSISQGVQRARAEAVARNTATTFTLVLDGTTFWRVTENASGDVIEQKPLGEQGATVTLTDSTDADVAAGSSMAFTALGGIQAASPLQQINVDSSALSDEEATELRIVVGASGSILICDPNLPDGDSRKCP